MFKTVTNGTIGGADDRDTILNSVGKNRCIFNLGVSNV